MDLEAMAKSEAEWQAWQDVVEELKRLGVDINVQDRLNNALVIWGDSLVILREVCPYKEAKA